MPLEKEFSRNVTGNSQVSDRRVTVQLRMLRVISAYLVRLSRYGRAAEENQFETIASITRGTLPRAPLRKYVTRQQTFIIRSALFANCHPRCYLTPGSARSWCRDASARSAPSIFSRVARIGISASGSFAAKSEWTLATTPFQCRNFVPCSGGMPARRASKTPSAFFQDTCATSKISGVGLTIT